MALAPASKSIRELPVFTSCPYMLVACGQQRPRSSPIECSRGLVKIRENRHFVWMDLDLTVVKVAVDKTERAILISGRLHAQGRPSVLRFACRVGKNCGRSEADNLAQAFASGDRHGPARYHSDLVAVKYG